MHHIDALTIKYNTQGHRCDSLMHPITYFRFYKNPEITNTHKLRVKYAILQLHENCFPHETSHNLKGTTSKIYSLLALIYEYNFT